MLRFRPFDCGRTCGCPLASVINGAQTEAATQPDQGRGKPCPDRTSILRSMLATTGLQVSKVLRWLNGLDGRGLALEPYPVPATEAADAHQRPWGFDAVHPG